MMKAWKEFWSDYNEMALKNGNKWLKKHWKGYIVLCLVAFFVPYAITRFVNRSKRRREIKEFLEGMEEVLNGEES